jgi:hypothetical protein
MKTVRRAMTYTVSLDRDLVKRFRAVCRHRQIDQSRVVTRMVKYYLAHRGAFARIVVKGEGVPDQGFLRRCAVCGRLLKAGDRWVLLDTGLFVTLRHEGCR